VRDRVGENEAGEAVRGTASSRGTALRGSEPGGPEPRVFIVGAGPGDPELLTRKGDRLLREADLVVWAGSLVNPELLSVCRPDCVRIDSARTTLEEQVEAMAAAARAGRTVVRLHTGDPSLYGAIGEQLRALRARGVAAEIVPGVSSLQGAAARLGIEYTVPGGTQTLIATRTAGRTPVPEEESLARLAALGTTLAVFLSADRGEEILRACREAGRSPDEPAAWVYRATWPDERIGRCTLGTLSASLEEAGIRNHALIVIGRCLEPGEVRSLLYDGGFAHGFREARTTGAEEGA
jgi:precorrin-4/cobalt-precorrin-4 C11-methyltransferase